MDHKQRTTAVEAFRAAVEKAGSQSAFARKTGILQQTISNLLRRADLCPPTAVIVVEREYGFSRHVLRPDVYPLGEADLKVTAPTVAFDRSAGMKRAAGA